jgi:hypothetical protein
MLGVYNIYVLGVYNISASHTVKNKTAVFWDVILCHTYRTSTNFLDPEFGGSIFPRNLGI